MVPMEHPVLQESTEPMVKTVLMARTAKMVLMVRKAMSVRLATKETPGLPDRTVPTDWTATPRWR